MNVFHRIDQFVTNDKTPVSLLVAVAVCFGLSFTVLVLTMTRLMVSWGIL